MAGERTWTRTADSTARSRSPRKRSRHRKRSSPRHRGRTLYLPDGRRSLVLRSSATLAARRQAEELFFRHRHQQVAVGGTLSEQIGAASIARAVQRTRTGMLVRLVNGIAGVINPAHTHRAARMYVLEGRWSRTRGLRPAASSGFRKASDGARLPAPRRRRCRFRTTSRSASIR